ncbi:MAG: Zn-dependent dipeptidase, microsomal dipeptidase-like protein [Pelotomaculum thermopropionicum]|uniref:Zn-dependent dipeptidase, microsomal dipeptidase-like protein n=1 Tax=Pelotomaculum thermopropionicum TaxID=110500 RepID=A0A117M482_9FIRM|nr:MAG: Zn-dependent dipeptidase, microsomal dipeptidase-like protein [Pelotomaculum thermopropionicum]
MGIFNNQDYILLHDESIVVDAHCDTLTAMLEQQRHLGEFSGKGHLDLPRLRTGGIKVQFFAAFIAPKFKQFALHRALELIDLYYREIEANNKDIVHIESLAGIYDALTSGKIAALLSVEGGEALECRLDVLRMLYHLGVRSLTLTWNKRNELGDGVLEGNTGGGLTSFGLAVVKELNRLGILVDVSHLSEKGFWDVLKYSKQPVMASHSNCQAICAHPRNLNDQQIKALAEEGGVMGITYVPDFLGGKAASVNEVLDHIDHAVSIGGMNCVGLGSDFDGMVQTPSGLEDCSKISVITRGLIERGYHHSAVKKILGDNFLRIIKQVLK